MSNFEACDMGRVKVSLRLNTDVAAAARSLGLDMSRVAQAAIAEAAKAARNRRWRDETRAAISAYEEEVTRDGVPLAEFRSF